MEFRGIIKATCSVMWIQHWRNKEQPLHLEQGKRLAKESHKHTHHTHTHTGPKASRFIHHYDKTLRSDQSQSVLHQCDSGRSRREGTPCPPAARAVNATRRNTLACHCHSINQALGRKRKHSSSEQTRTRKHLRRD